MKKLNQLEESKFLKLFFAFISVCFLIAAVCMPDRNSMFTGLWEILKNPASDPNPTPRTAEFYKLRPCERMVATAAALLEDYIAAHPSGERP